MTISDQSSLSTIDVSELISTLVYREKIAQTIEHRNFSIEVCFTYSNPSNIFCAYADLPKHAINDAHHDVWHLLEASV